MGCSRQTLRAGLARLQRQGLIWRHVGQGTFVGPPSGRSGRYRQKARCCWPGTRRFPPCPFR
ncbi:GntR family transcriptional regulator [Paracoccus yeei]|uniref:GntR family transcriptional regulator n=1 Tax=Paracoccus yeei TaxID=147645 RepID=UPI0028D15E12|nr:GntR family transcriptional regulator [Paracoccus yeei]